MYKSKVNNPLFFSHNIIFKLKLTDVNSEACDGRNS